MIYVVTYIEVQPDYTSSAGELIDHYVKNTAGEHGNAGAFPLQEIHRRNRFVVVEAWKDEPAFQAHENAGQTAQFHSRLKDVHVSPYDQRVHHEFAVQPDSNVAGSASLFVVTHVDVPPPRREETEILLKRLAEESRKDDGNLRYDVFQQSSRTNHFTVVAAWADEKSFVSYGMQRHTREFREALGPMLGAPYDERLFAPPEARA